MAALGLLQDAAAQRSKQKCLHMGNHLNTAGDASFAEMETFRPWLLFSERQCNLINQHDEAL